MAQGPPEIGGPEWDELRKVYQHPDQIDLYIGGLAETHVPGRILWTIYVSINNAHCRRSSWSHICVHHWNTVSETNGWGQILLPPYWWSKYPAS